MDAEVWFGGVIRPALADTGGLGALFISTPDGTAVAGFMTCGVTSQTTKRRRWQRVELYDDFEGGNVSKQEVEAARAQLDTRTFRQEFEASPSRTSDWLGGSQLSPTTTSRQTRGTYRSSRCCWALTSTWIQ